MSPRAIKQALRSSSIVNEALLKEISIIEARRLLTSSDLQAPIATQERCLEVAEKTKHHEVHVSESQSCPSRMTSAPQPTRVKQSYQVERLFSYKEHTSELHWTMLSSGKERVRCSTTSDSSTTGVYAKSLTIDFSSQEAARQEPLFLPSTKCQA
jgi:hypothetical protein